MVFIIIYECLYLLFFGEKEKQKMPLKTRIDTMIEKKKRIASEIPFKQTNTRTSISVSIDGLLNLVCYIPLICY